MTPDRRRLKIAEAVQRQGRLSVDALALEFAVSAETIRRDLARLSADGLVQKIHGGALPPRLTAEGSFRERMAEDAAAKQVIATEVAELVPPGSTLFIDTGSTTLVAARELARVEGLTVITNSQAVADAFARAAAARSYLLGGDYRSDNAQTVGPLAIDQIARFQADIALITVSALDGVAGAMDADFDEAQVARAMIARARETVVAAASSKFERRAAHHVCTPDRIHTLVCERPPAPELAASLQSQGVRIVAETSEPAVREPVASAAADDLG